MADDVQHPLGPQPEVHLLTQSYRNVAGEMGKILNLPQFDTGNAILDQLQQINTAVRETNTRLDTAVREINTRLDTAVREVNTRLDTAVREINTRFDGIDARLNGIDARLDGIDTRLQISDRNNAARISNSLLSNFDDTLAPLTNPTDNTPIAGFPPTPIDIRNMQVAVLNNVLRQLGLGVEGNRLAKEQRLRVFIGLKRGPA